MRVRIRTPWPVAGVKAIEGSWDVEFVEAMQPRCRMRLLMFRTNSHRTGRSMRAARRFSYRRWTDLFEFLVTPDARQIQARTLSHVEDEAMLAYLLVDALSFSMVRLGWSRCARQPWPPTAEWPLSRVTAAPGNRRSPPHS
jgi:hypothetical protein